MAVTSTTPFSSAVSAPPRLPSAVICTSPCLSPAFSITSTPIISPSDFGLLMPNFLPFMSAAVLSGELGMTITTRSASDREVKLDDLDVLALVGGRDHRRGGDIAVAERRSPSRCAPSCRRRRPQMMPVMSTPCFLKKPFSSAMRVGRAGWIVLVLRDQQVFRLRRSKLRQGQAPESECRF